MPDFTSIKTKIADLKARIENNSISPLSLGTILDEIMDLCGIHPVEAMDITNADLVIADENCNPILTLADGHIRTAGFNSADISTSLPVQVADTTAADLIIANEDLKPIVSFANGHIRTANFDSSTVSGSGSFNAPSSSAGKIDLPGKWCSLGTSITAWDNHRTNDIRGYQYWVRKRVNFAGGYVNNGVNSYRMYSLAENLSLIVNADYYTLEFGTNDFLGGISLGTMDDYINATGKSTFLGAMRIVVDKIYQVNPNALIMLCTPRKCYYSEFGVPKWDAPNSQGVKITAFVDAVRDVAQYESLPVADFFALTNTNRHNLPAHSNDVALHPNTLGHQMMANVMVEQFRLFHSY